MTVLFKKISDPIKDSAGNVVVSVLYWDDAAPSRTYTETFKAFDASDEAIGDWAIKRLMVQTTADAAIVDLAATKNVETTAAPKVDPDLMATLAAAEKAFRRAALLAQFDDKGKPAAALAAQALVDAQDAVLGK